MQSYDSFLKYVAHLNMLLNKNMPFLKAKFGVTTIQIMTALAGGGILTEGLKRKWFDKSLSKTTILVQFTTVPLKEETEATEN